MINMDILVNVTIVVFLIGMVSYACYETNRQDREFAEWQKEAEKKA